MTELPVNQELLALAMEGVRYGLHIASGKETFQPARITQTTDGQTNLTQLIVTKSDDVLADARRLLLEEPEVHRAALIMDGAVNLSGASEDAVIVQVGQRGGPAHEFVQRYRRKRLSKRVEAVGNVGYAGERPPLFE